MTIIRLRTALQLGSLVTIALAIVVSIALALGFYFEGGAIPWRAFAVSAVLGAFALVMAGALYVVGVSIAGRVRRLEETARQVRSGDLSASVCLDGRDEVAEIAEVFDEMIVSLRHYVELIPAHQNLQQELEKMREVVSGLRNRNMEISDSLQRLRRAQDQFTHRDHTGVIGKMVATVSGDFTASLTMMRQITEKALTVAGDNAPLGRELTALRSVMTDAQERQTRLTSFLGEAQAQALEPLDLASVVAEAIELAEPKWREREGGVVVHVENEVGTLQPVQGNRGDLVQLLTHLLFNAAEAMPKGGTITVGAQLRKGTVTITVTDTGVGMSALTMKRCFLPFFSTKEGAAGIGLTLAQGIVRQHEGKIGVESQPDAGTTVVVELPLAGRQQPAPAPLEQPPASSRAMSILLVEDDAWTRDAIRQNLAGDKQAIEVADNGADAIAKMQHKEFDVVITDRAMPDISGEEIALEAKRLYPRMPVVMLTGFGALMREKGEKPANVDVVLGKPVNFADLRRTMEELAQRAPPGVPG